MLDYSYPKTDFEQKGYLVLENFIPVDLCERLMQRASSLIEEFDSNTIKTIFSTKHQHHAKQDYFLDSGDKIRFFFEEQSINEDGTLKFPKSLCINKIGHALHDLDPIFNAFGRNEKIALLIDALGVKNPLITQSMYICKQPFIGGEVTCHQDATYLFVKTNPIIGLWFALEDATLENGCLWAIPGGHRIPLKARMRRNQRQISFETYDKTPWPLDEMIPLEVSRGSLIVLNGLLPHMSKENTSNRSRHAYTLHVFSGNDEFATDNWLQRPVSMPFVGFN